MEVRREAELLPHLDAHPALFFLSPLISPAHQTAPSPALASPSQALVSSPAQEGHSVRPVSWVSQRQKSSSTLAER